MLNNDPHSGQRLQLVQIISPERLSTYLEHSNGNVEKALALHLWNTRLASAFWLPVQSFEIALRNQIDRVLWNRFCDNEGKCSSHWTQEKAFLNICDERLKNDLEKQVRKYSRNGTLDAPQLVANQTMGFWVKLLGGRFNREIWSRHLNDAFPGKPSDITLAETRQMANEIRIIRNRISHHEPLIKRDVSKDFSNTMTLLRWLSPDMAGWIKPHLNVMEIIRQKP